MTHRTIKAAAGETTRLTAEDAKAAALKVAAALKAKGGTDKPEKAPSSAAVPPKTFRSKTAKNRSASVSP